MGNKIYIRKEDLLYVLNQSNSIEEVAMVFNVSPNTIKRRMEEYNINKSALKGTVKRGRGYSIYLTKDQILEAQNKTVSASAAARYLGVSLQTYKRRAEVLGIYIKNQGLKGTHKIINPSIDLRTYKCKDDAFAYLTEDVAYWLGFIASDGYVNQKRNFIYFKLKREDKAHLENLKDFLDFNGPIIDRYSEITKNGYKQYPVSELTVHSKQIVKDLVEKYDIVQGKTEKGIKTFSLLPNKYKLAFIFGYFDGDGSASFSKEKGYQVLSIVSHKVEILEEFKKWFSTVYNLDFHIYCKNKNDISVNYELKISKKDYFIFFAKLYCSYYGKLPLLERRYKKFLQYLNMIKN